MQVQAGTEDAAAAATGGNIVWVNVAAQTTSQGQTLYAGWNLICLQ